MSNEPPSAADAVAETRGLRVIGGKLRTAREADAAERVHSLSVRILVKSQRELRKMAVPAAGRRRLQLLEIVESTQLLRRSHSLSEVETTLAKLRDHLQEIDSICVSDPAEAH